MSPPLIALFIAAFAFGTTEFVIAGVLPEVAAGLGIGVPTAGYLISAYALGIAIGGPILTIATARLSRRSLIVGLVAAFTIGQALCALAPGFGSMLLFRFLTAMAHGAYFGVALVAAVALVPEAQRGRAVAFVLAGLTVSNVVGVPAGTAIGAFWGWRATFWATFILGLAAAIAVTALLPRAKAAASTTPTTLGNEMRVLARQQVWSSLIVMLMLMAAQFVPFTYITPMLGNVTRLGAGWVPWVLLLIGFGSTVGVFCGGRLADWKLMPALTAMMILQAIVLAMIYLAGSHALPMVALLFLWGGLNFSIGTAIQTRILAWTADAPNLAASLIPSGFNIGIALAAFIGAQLLDGGYGYRSLPLPGVASMLIGTLVAFLSAMAEQRTAGSSPVVKTTPSLPNPPEY